MDFKKIRKNIKVHKYRCLDDIDVDMALLCKNAQTYNMEGSLVRGIMGVLYNTTDECNTPCRAALDFCISLIIKYTR